MPAKTKKHPEVIALYREHDFLTAYALHTDQRIRTTGYQAAVGAGDNWDEHGRLQRDFLVRVAGLRPEHRLLEFGCGTGRLARQVVPYLEPDHYLGVDISEGAIAAARELAEKEGWAARAPSFALGAVPAVLTPQFHCAWAYSVFIHLPPDAIVAVMRQVAAFMVPAGRFYWSYVPEQKNWRSGVKQFRATLEVYRKCAKSAGLTFEDVPNWISKAGHKPARWTGSQRVAVSRKS